MIFFIKKPLKESEEIRHQDREGELRLDKQLLRTLALEVARVNGDGPGRLPLLVNYVSEHDLSLDLS